MCTSLRKADRITQEEEQTFINNNKRQKQQHGNKSVSTELKRRQSLFEDVGSSIVLTPCHWLSIHAAQQEQDPFRASAKRHKQAHDHEVVGSAALAPEVGAGANSGHDRDNDQTEDVGSLALEDGAGISSADNRNDDQTEDAGTTNAETPPGSTQKKSS